MARSRMTPPPADTMTPLAEPTATSLEGGATSVTHALSPTQPDSAHADAAATARTYWCFISYRHVDNRDRDRAWASWLHQEIERYDVPGDLVGTVMPSGENVPGRIYPLFRDEESLPADHNLGEHIA